MIPGRKEAVRSRQLYVLQETAREELTEPQRLFAGYLFMRVDYVPGLGSNWIDPGNFYSDRKEVN